MQGELSRSPAIPEGCSFKVSCLKAKFIMRFELLHFALGYGDKSQDKSTLLFEMPSCRY
jgi:hypothetical protein